MYSTRRNHRDLLGSALLHPLSCTRLRLGSKARSALLLGDFKATLTGSRQLTVPLLGKSNLVKENVKSMFKKDVSVGIFCTFPHGR